MTGKFEIRPLTLSEAQTLVNWAKDEGWNPGINDAARFYGFDPGGFIGCIIGGKLVAGISAIAYGDDFGFIGLYICRPDMRGKGIGKRVWDAGMARLEGRTIGLDGVPEQQQNYAAMGFHAQYRTWRWSGKIASTGVARCAVFTLDELAAFDARYFPARRDSFIKQWIEPPHRVFVSKDDNGICGYGVSRACVDGYKIGPLFAKTDEDALLVFDALCADLGEAVVHIDMPETAASFASLLAAKGMAKGFITARMYKAAFPTVDQAGIYGTTTLELG